MTLSVIVRFVNLVQHGVRYGQLALPQYMLYGEVLTRHSGDFIGFGLIVEQVSRLNRLLSVGLTDEESQIPVIRP